MAVERNTLDRADMVETSSLHLRLVDRLLRCHLFVCYSSVALPLTRVGDLI
jgi:hypothetical protein